MDNGGVAAGLPLHVGKEAGTDRHDIAGARGKNRLSTCVGTLRNQDWVYDELNNRSTRAFAVDSRNVKISRILPH